MSAQTPSPDESNAIAELHALVEALDATNWPSWQSTYKFYPKLESAKEFLKGWFEKHPGEA